MKKFIAALSAAMLALVLVASPAAATRPAPDHKVTICHRTASDTNPYVFISVDIASWSPGHLGNADPGHKPTKWKSAGTFRGVAHVKGDPKDDYLAESAADCNDFAPTQPPTEAPTSPPTDSPTPTPTPVVTPTPVPSPTQFTGPTPTPTPSPSSTPTSTPTESGVPTPTPSSGASTPPTASNIPSLTPSQTTTAPRLTLPPSDTEADVVQSVNNISLVVFMLAMVGGTALMVRRLR